jgi:vWA domain found in the FtsH ternary systems/N-terminal helical region fused to the FtsH ternary system vWA domain
MTLSLHREEAADWVAGGLCLARLVAPGADAATRAGPWILATMGERLDLPPVGVVADIGALLFSGSLDPLRATSAASAAGIDDPALATAIRRYEDTVLGRLAADPRLVSAGFAVARLPERMHAQAVGILVAGLLLRLELDAGVEVPPGVVRSLTERTPRLTGQRGFTALREDAALRERLTEGYSALVRAAQRSRDLLGDADLFALENLTVLGSMTQRMAVADVWRAQEVIHAAVPRRVPRRRRKEGVAASRLEEESVYPVGGFSSVSTSGSLENLVTSELIYMDPPVAKGAMTDGSAAIDLFDMRYVEGELLYYTRDEGIFVRQRRLVILAIDPDLVRARIKDPGLPWQRIVLALAILLVVIKKLVELLGDEALAVRVVFLGEDPLALEDEKSLAELLLREWTELGLVEVVTSTWAEVEELAATAARRALVQVVRITTTPGKVPRPLDVRVSSTEFPIGAATLDDWSRATTDLLSSLV